MQKAPAPFEGLSYESQLFLTLLASAVVAAVGIFVAYRIRRLLHRRAARRRARSRRVQSSASPGHLGSS